MSSQTPDFHTELRSFRLAMAEGSRFDPLRTEEGRAVGQIISNVAQRGDEALAEYTKKFDGVDLAAEQFRIKPEQMAQAHSQIDSKLLESLRKAIENVRTYQSKIFIGGRSEFSSGTGIKYTPIRRVGLCIPGAAAPLPSTVIMTAVPAQVAGVEDIVVVSPPRFEGSIHPVILAVCHELGVSQVYRIGGAQAVAALAVGTDSIEKVDMIVGPGNKWVQTAKKMVSYDYVGIESVAGPSEVLIVANEQADAAWVAADMLSQAEHGADSSAVVVTDSATKAEEILANLKEQVAKLARSQQALASLTQYSRIIVVRNMDEAIELADDFASEHLEIQCGSESREVAMRIRNAGAIFIGPHTPVAAGDYWAGPSHTLPTGSSAKFSSALTSNDFVKSISLIEYDRRALAESADDIIRLAEVEGLDAHANSVRIRQRDEA